MRSREEFKAWFNDGKQFDSKKPALDQIYDWFAPEAARPTAVTNEEIDEIERKGGIKAKQYAVPMHTQIAFMDGYLDGYTDCLSDFKGKRGEMRTFMAKEHFWVSLGPDRQFVFIGTLMRVQLITQLPLPEEVTRRDFVDVDPWAEAAKYWEEVKL